MDAQDQRRGYLRSRGGSGQDAHHVYGSLRDETAGVGKQADDYRTEGKRLRHRRHVPQGLSQCKDSIRSEEHTSELQSRQYLVCRLLLEKKKTPTNYTHSTYINTFFLAYDIIIISFNININLSCSSHLYSKSSLNPYLHPIVSFGQICPA